MKLSFTEALLVAEWVFGPFDTENDLRDKKKHSCREDRLSEASVIQQAVRGKNLFEAAEALRDIATSVDAYAEAQLDLLAGRVTEAARRIVAARPPFYDIADT